MPSSARSTCTQRQRARIGAAAFGILVLLVVLVNPFAGRAFATTIPMVFPLEKRVPVLHDYLAPRTGHLHQGTDLMAPKMTKELACVSGTVTLRVGTYNGWPAYSLWLAGDDGHGYFYIHINNDTPGTDDNKGGLRYAFAPGLVSGAHVKQGQFIAYVGDSGNAEGGPSHLHFEIHQTTSMSSSSMNPYDSLVNAPLYNGNQPPPPPAPTPTRYEQTDQRLAYTDSWGTAPNPGASGGSWGYINTDGGAVAVNFTGTSFAWVTVKSPNYGIAKVTLDGGSPVNVDLYSADTTWQQTVWSATGLTSSSHTVTIAWTGDKNAAAKDSYVGVDAFDILGNLTQATTPPPPPAPTPTRYEQTNARIVYLGNWLTFVTSGASGGNYIYADSPATALIWFTGTKLDLIATKGYTQGKARVSVDGGAAALLDLYNPTTLRQQKVWSTGVLAPGTHKVTWSWSGQRSVSGGGTRVNIDAIDPVGMLGQAALTTAEQTSAALAYTGAWIASSSASASGGSFLNANSAGSSVTIHFTGSYLVWLATRSPAYGIAKATLDSRPPVSVDLYSATTAYKQKVWSTGVLATGPHTLKIEWTGQRRTAATGTTIDLDAFQLLGNLN